MDAIAPDLESTIERRVFPRWSIIIPTSFDETFVADEEYWHAWDATRSVSLTSVILSHRTGKSIQPRELLRRVPPPKGEAVAMPPGLLGWAVIIDAPPPATAGRAISGMIAVKNAALLVTVTSDDLGWAAKVWESIRRW
jgi:hypothetical protein